MTSAFIVFICIINLAHIFGFSMHNVLSVYVEDGRVPSFEHRFASMEVALPLNLVLPLDKSKESESERELYRS